MADNENLGAPQSRNEALLQNILGANYDLGEPQSRNEALLMKIAGEDVDVDFEPQSRIEVLLKEIIEQGGGGGGMTPSEALNAIFNRSFTGDIVINVTNPESNPTWSGWIAYYKGLLHANLIKSLKITGLAMMPQDFCNQQYSGTNGSTSVLESVEFDGTHCGQSSFAYCKALKTIKMPNLTVGYFNYQKTSSNMFDYCTALEQVSFPKLERCESNFLSHCTSLKVVDFGAMGYLNDSNFNGDTILEKLIIRTPSVCTLNNINNFANTPFASGGTGGTLYVPQALISSYQSATNWSTILGYANNQILSIEGSIYETQYADGTPIS